MKKAGKVTIKCNDFGIRIINISLLPAFHGNGIGTKIIRDVIADADIKKKHVCLEVDKINPAFNLYKRLGFEIITQDEIKYSMRYIPLNSCEVFKTINIVHIVIILHVLPLATRCRLMLIILILILIMNANKSKSKIPKQVRDDIIINFQKSYIETKFM
jgi:hypothetical protein